MSLSNRQATIIRYLLTNGVVNNYDELAKHCDCSAKTIYRDIKKIESMSNDLGFVLNKSHGISIQCNQIARIRLQELVFTSRTSNEFSVENRRNLIYLDLLLNAPNQTSINILSEKYIVSNSSIVNDLDEIKRIAEKSGLKMVKTHKGTYLQGDELLIRSEIAQILGKIQSNFDKTIFTSNRLEKETYMVLAGIYGKDDIRNVERSILAIEEAIGVTLSDTYYVNIVTHMLIAMERIRNNNLIDYDEAMNKYAGNEIFIKIKEIIDKFSSVTGINFPINEVFYIYTHFMGCGINEVPDRNVIALRLETSNHESLEFCNELILNMEKETSCSFTNDTNLFYSLLLHINSMITRIKYNVRISCEIKESIMLEYAEIFNDVKKITLKLKKEYFKDAFISDDEIAYLSLYFKLALEKKNNRIRTLIICSTGVGTSHILKKKIEKAFSEIEVIDVISTRQLSKRSLDGVNLIITTVKINENIGCAIANVSVMMNQNDIEEIKKCIERNN